jgi:hypothetical protein
LIQLARTCAHPGTQARLNAQSLDPLARCFY